ncbi:MAG TPA: GNAT family N-acetyltransferase, partial [Candidatus Eisenbacteria bacterium]
MAFTIVPCGKGDIETVRGLLLHPSLQGEFSMLTLPGVLEDNWEDPYADFELRWLALADGVPAGYLFTLVLPSTPLPWALIRVGVIAPHRRHGLGSALLETCFARLREQTAARGIGEVCVAAWLPSESASGFAARHGFQHARYFWKMERARGNPPEPSWPAGIETRTFGGDEAALRDWNDAYNDSFAEHYHYVASDIEHARSQTRQRVFRPDGLIMAYRDGHCVGYCRNTIRGREGEIALLGVVRAARGIGLGRALLRWSAGWLERQGCEPIELHVDGENEN